MTCGTANTKHQTMAAKPVVAVACVRIPEANERRQDPGTKAGSFMG